MILTVQIEKLDITGNKHSG